MRAVAWVLGLMVAAGPAAVPARAEPTAVPVVEAPNAAWVRRVERGEVMLEAHGDASGRGGAVRAMIDIAATPQTVWAVILDCARAARMTTSVKQCRVLSRDGSGRIELREHVVKWGFLLPALHSTSRLTLDPYKTIAFRCEGGDIKDCEGQWRLDPLEDGKGTRVTYQNRATAPFGLPNGLATLAMRRDVPNALRALRRESLAAR